MSAVTPRWSSLCSI